MTMPGFGQITPIQRDMLLLAGYNLNPLKYGFDPHRPGAETIPDEDRIAIMKQGREALVRVIGQDFGYDLAAWQGYLEADEELGYTHPYAYRGTREFIEDALASPLRQRLIEKIEGRA